ncbi:branched-chain amino acid transport system II carrier protein [Lysinibacillus agricola]|uniref:Branched-chain amino acid transport system carrier protein n=1 Tax=Lysinibacillus agricola TaxID=2590012 RepID=A0ABX7AYF2_9BACI|nr:MULTISPECIES: branched-chain amino acid transport system II carrier protein [Lysinibacillus]KOS60758.1 branched-chain amino acid transporter [Lysinibacillus sp. FJAT-14222]QQP13219.1 branched-chain amino acid transport system II carrier protein [Lysinibacillus agricola]
MKNIMLFIKENLAVGLLLFALFLGAGNIIFPPLLGQQAGEYITPAMIGFLITGVGLPLLAIVAVAKAGGDLQLLANRVGPIFGVIFTSIVYLAIGPFFAVPRTGSVSYEIGIAPFLPEAAADHWAPLFITSILFFALILCLAINPTKLIDRVGKILTPVLLLVILLLAVKSFVSPMGEPGTAIGKYTVSPFSEGFVQGYLTMDVLSALVFGIVILQALRGMGMSDTKKQVKTTIFAGIVAAIGLSFVYISLGHIGNTSIDAIGISDNGGIIIAKSAEVLFGKLGSIILSVTILLACISTAVGLLNANAQFFNKLFPRISYKTFIVIFTILSMAITNIGLSTIISASLPVLLIIYPLAMVLMVLSLVDNFFKGGQIVYILALIPTFFVSLYDGLKEMNIKIAPYESILKALPFYEQSLGWLVPAIIGALIGLIIHKLIKK